MAPAPLFQIARRCVGCRHWFHRSESHQALSANLCEALFLSSSSSLDDGHAKGSPADAPDLDPFELVKPELDILSENLRSRIGHDVPILRKAASYFFELGAEGKMFRPSLLLLMANAVLRRANLTLYWWLSLTSNKRKAPSDEVA